ncbi:hypothetical protein F6X40_10140 [Paraburkholderia sp. UCT31]|uniref:hypothetical protein n=1 Tax=Paraburkholderia sp. UCT31 TaxID=2615209 RepID=UPI0016553FF2|nr:hypothetical protein [Paraburkholderia sp. UCT31]MBC8737167.1 hypothetical protein [Paraburkholderia sp. UCT31]
MTELRPTPLHAGELLYKGLQRISPTVTDPHYKRLLALYEAERDFRDMVEEFANGMQLRVLSVTPRGIAVVPANADSMFAINIGDIKSGMKREEKALHVLTYTAIAALFYPTAENLADDAWHSPRISDEMVVSALRSICQTLKHKSEQDLEGISPELEPGWNSVLVKPETRAELQRQNSSSLTGLVALVLRQLLESGLVAQDTTAGAPRYTATWRLTVQLRELIVERLFIAAREALNPQDAVAE